MRDEQDDTATIYIVVMNAKEEYSIWLADQPLPEGWSEVGKKGIKSECLSYVKEVWTDMRPLRLRQQMARD